MSIVYAVILGMAIGPIGAVLEGQSSNILGYSFAITIYLLAVAVLEGIPAGLLGAIGIVALPWRESRSLLYAPAVFSAGTIGIIACLIRMAENEPRGLPPWALLLLVSYAGVGAIWPATPLGRRFSEWARPIPRHS